MQRSLPPAKKLIYNVHNDQVWSGKNESSVFLKKEKEDSSQSHHILGKGKLIMPETAHLVYYSTKLPNKGRQ